MTATLIKEWSTSWGGHRQLWRLPQPLPDHFPDHHLVVRIDRPWDRSEFNPSILPAAFDGEIWSFTIAPRALEYTNACIRTATAANA